MLAHKFTFNFRNEKAKVWGGEATLSYKLGLKQEQPDRSSSHFTSQCGLGKNTLIQGY